MTTNQDQSPQGLNERIAALEAENALLKCEVKMALIISAALLADDALIEKSANALASKWNSERTTDDMVQFRHDARVVLEAVGVIKKETSK